MRESFEFLANPSRVIFGTGTIERVAHEVGRLGGERVLVLTTPQQADQGETVGNLLGDANAGMFANATMHTPMSVTEEALRTVDSLNVDCLLAIGGGSTTGLSKAIALRTDLPQVVVPTTYAGSEMTTILGETQDGRKKTIRDPKVLPETVIYDVDLTLGLPGALSVTSGINAMAHAVEALYAQNGNPVLSMFAEEGVRQLARSLPIISQSPKDRTARRDALYGAWLCALCLGTSGVALHHKLCHVLGGSFDLPHAETHTIVLPHAVAYNAPAVPDAMNALKRALNTDQPAGTLYDLAEKLKAPTALSDLGLEESAVDSVVHILFETEFWNPRSLDQQEIRSLVSNARLGIRPV